ncbi:hypothetical protein VD0002_g7496 [Verticillium dahliae]|uniref:Uncharacterized protein n=2 Tax=Verticillium TaxID=1036719 RepID=A0A2J8BU37_VERDA|nr:hypothetical protein HYQ44_008453 [Verticillium longisporum]PNH28282.1 hypothetical protein BJF96_g8411 [Verticillium dahliae]PNH38204.1 hypothetical protein VD0004_g8612 [Verticillium dahliae]PNH50830.1 hypothetical protein VD0003_g6356 [Verticillium dahliae]PNH60088.1 hypothetical protein VD0002_g7496 [Verticillium dahliae]
MPNTNMPTQRPFFLSTFFASFRQAPNTSSLAQQPNKHTTQSASSSSAAAYAQQQSASSASSNPRAIAPPSATGSVVNQLPLHSPRGAAAAHGVPIPGSSPGRRRGSDSSSEGFRDVLGAEKWYVGGRTAGGEERFFKMGVVRRVRSNDGLSLDRMSL